MNVSIKVDRITPFSHLRRICIHPVYFCFLPLFSGLVLLHVTHLVILFFLCVIEMGKRVTIIFFLHIFFLADMKKRCFVRRLRWWSAQDRHSTAIHPSRPFASSLFPPRRLCESAEVLVVVVVAAVVSCHAYAFRVAPCSNPIWWPGASLRFGCYAKKKKKKKLTLPGLPLFFCVCELFLTFFLFFAALWLITSSESLSWKKWDLILNI